MNEEIKKTLTENNYVISQEQYHELFNPLTNPDVVYVKYQAHINKFNVAMSNHDFFEFKVENKSKIKKLRD